MIRRNFDTKAQAEEAMTLSREIQPMLKGRTAEVQGAALADLLAIFIAGHHPDLREEILRWHIKITRSLIPASVKQIREQQPGKLPEDW